MVWSWLYNRAKEKSTWIGLATAATALGFPEIGLLVGKAGTIVVAVLAGGLIAHRSG